MLRPALEGARHERLAAGAAREGAGLFEPAEVAAAEEDG
jgi:hypothetical protein